MTNDNDNDYIIETCNTCRFYEEMNGECRRYPPVLNLRSVVKEPRADFPSPVLTNMWCGEWRSLDRT